MYLLYVFCASVQYTQISLPIIYYTTLLQVLAIPSRSNKFDQCVHHLWQLSIDDCQAIYMYVCVYIYICVCVCVCLSTLWLHKGGAEVWLYSFLTSASAGSEWLTLRPSRFTPGKQTHCPLNARLDGPLSRFGRFWEEETLFACRDSNPRWSNP